MNHTPTQQNSQLTDFARQVHTWGANVVAIKRGAKHPIHPWEVYQNERQTEAQLERELEALRSGKAGAIAIVNGFGGWRSFDLDAPKDASGQPLRAVDEKDIQDLLIALGLPDDYQWSYRSGSGAGFGAIIRCTDLTPDLPPPAKSVYIGAPQAGRSFGQLELRWTSGITIIAGLHPSGPGYCWRLGIAPFLLPAERSPQEIARGFGAIAYQGGDDPPATPPASANGAYTAGAPSHYGAAALADAIRRVSAAQPGQRNNTLYAQVTALAELVNGGELSTDDVGRVMTSAALAAGLTPDETAATIKSAFDKVGGKVRQPPPKVPRMAQNGPTTGGAPQPGQIPTTPPPVIVGERIPLADLAYLTDCYHQEELGDGYLFARLYEGRLVYDHAEKNWYLWLGNYWGKDETGQIKLLYSGQVAAQYLEGASVLTRLASAAATTNKADADAKSDLSQSFVKRARQLQKRHRTTNALDYAAAVMGVTAEVWDKCPGFLPVENGLLDLSTGTLTPGKPDDFIRTYAPTDWHGIDEPCPRWELFISEIMAGDPEMAAFMQRLLGYGISGLATDHKYPILWGETGRNGKDTLMETLGYVLGPMAGAISKDVVLDSGKSYQGAPAPHILDLRGKRIVWVSEPREGARLDAAQVKLISGGGRLKVRGMYERDMTEWQPTHFAMLITNPRPHAPADDQALWERILLIPFRERFVDNPQGVNEHPADKKLREKLQLEASGILAWLVRGFMEWERQGLNPPQEVTDATADYKQREDTLSQFLQEQYIPKIGGQVAANDLFQSYLDWCGAWGIDPMGGKAFGEKMKARLPVGRTNAGIVYLNIERRP